MKDYTKGRSPEMLEPFFPNEIFRKIIVCSFLLIYFMGKLDLFGIYISRIICVCYLQYLSCFKKLTHL